MRRRIPGCFAPASEIVAPAFVATFGGRMESDPPFILQMFFGIKKDCPRDGRNWDAIRAWAKEVGAGI